MIFWMKNDPGRGTPGVKSLRWDYAFKFPNNSKGTSMAGVQ